MISIIQIIKTIIILVSYYIKNKRMTFTIAQTKTTPFADFRDGYLIIKGKSFTLDSPEIFETILTRLIIYFQNPEKHTCIDFNLSVLNGVSKRYIVNTFRTLEQFVENGSDVEINWLYQPDNEDIKEFGEICKANFKINIQLKIGL
jgi:hypothetical protein